MSGMQPRPIRGTAVRRPVKQMTPRVYRRARRPVPGITRRVGWWGRYNRLDSKEYKFYEGQFGSTGLPGDAITISPTLLDIPAGTGESERIGRKIMMRSLSMNWTMKKLPGTTANSQNSTTRMVVFLDKQCNGTAALGTDIFFGAAPPNLYQAFFNLVNTGRFVILFDKTYTLRGKPDGVTAVATQGADVDDHCHKTMNIPIEYSGVTGAITEIRSNNIGVAFLQDGSSSLVDVLGRFRVRYSDS